MGKLDINNFYNDLVDCGKTYAEHQLELLECDLANAIQKNEELEMEHYHCENEMDLLKAKIGACKNVLKWEIQS